MKNYVLIVGAFIVGFFLTIGVYMGIAKKHIVVISPLALSQFSLEKPPSKSLVGNITNIVGSVSWQSRTNATPSPITAPQVVQQGEEVATGKNGQTLVSFSDILTLFLANNTDLAVIQTLPANIVLEQKTGVVTYKKLASSIPVSIRALDLLMNLQAGEYMVGVQSDTSFVKGSVTAGVATVAFTDTNNVSQVKTLTTGQKFVFNNNTKTLTLTY